MIRPRIVDLVFDAIELGVAAYDWLRKRSKKAKTADPVKPKKRPAPGPLKQR